MGERKPYFDYGGHGGLILPHKQWPTLYSSRADSTGIQEWTIKVECKDEGGLITVTFGTINGQKQVQTKLIKDGKNIGRKNATSPFEQASREALASWVRKQEREGYKPDINLLSDDEKRPMLAEVYWDCKAAVDWGQAYAQPKFDGFRCLATKENGVIILLSRQHNTLYGMDHIFQPLHDVLNEGDCLDGELWSPDLTFQAISSAVKRESDRTAQLQYVVYDAIHTGSFATRFEFAKQVVARAKCPSIFCPETIRIRDEAQLLQAHDKWVKNDALEGAMLRHGSAAYRKAARSTSLLKVKVFQDAEFTVTGVTEGTGTHAGLAVFTCVTASGAAFRVESPGKKAEQREYFLQGQRYIGKRLKVKFKCMTDSVVPVPREPVALGFVE